ncbi:MAG TPA: LON peptidase substrate-binding domain-containing protein [Polyangiaceae bacterium]|jgi:ATP-dependent Lon protease
MMEEAALEGALDELPVFPLPSVVLFPRAVLPLHVFEPRYRSMLAHCLATHRCMAMAYVVDGEEPPGIARVAGVGVVMQHQALPDGRSNILLLGRARVALDELPFAPPFRRARAQLLADGHTDVSDMELASLHAAASGFIAEVRRHDANVEFALPTGVDAGGAADLCAHHLVVDPGARQRVLEELDVVARVLLVTTALAAQTSRLASERPGGTN